MLSNIGKAIDAGIPVSEKALVECLVTGLENPDAHTGAVSLDCAKAYSCLTKTVLSDESVSNLLSCFKNTSSRDVLHVLWGKTQRWSEENIRRVFDLPTEQFYMITDDSVFEKILRSYKQEESGDLMEKIFRMSSAYSPTSENYRVIKDFVTYIIVASSEEKLDASIASKLLHKVAVMEPKLCFGALKRTAVIYRRCFVKAYSLGVFDEKFLENYSEELLDVETRLSFTLFTNYYKKVGECNV